MIAHHSLRRAKAAMATERDTEAFLKFLSSFMLPDVVVLKPET